MRTRLTAVLLLGATLTLIIAPPAQAHVRVEGSSPGKGGYGLVRLTVPTESDTASTIGLTVTIPDDVTLSSARVLPIPGWSATVSTTGQRVTTITWTAEDKKGLGPAEFGLFTFSAGPWPKDRDEVPLPTTQRYSDGTSVEWNEVAVDAVSEPEHPAPIVTLGEAATDHHGAVTTHETQLAASEQQTEEDTDGNGTELAQWALIGIAVILAASAAARRGR
ncbi:uncharacterized protein YcnI [Actinoplanes lutulentus]|uniref:Uncharacterized protein YcnI n=1 Tax=Actinoplanes lutulentus TaxID=1287878 RepID=A0A327Z3V3_9ACTN|nr:YcnI family protein [Actinoplanes lutulentus]MBB2946914.1 uncharacterized protein YcnI [Actinoplanes lutulentus]RAK30417.1 uncharacterized protein YcnI [Actinoplanes lutulentus]